MTKVTPIQQTNTDGEVIDTYFDITIIIDKNNHTIIVDNMTKDYKDLIDGNTLVIKKVEIHI